MKSAAVFRRIIVSFQIFSPLIGSSAFVLGMRNRNRNYHLGYPPTTTIHASDSMVMYSATATAMATMSEEDNVFDFIAAATNAAVNRENCETKANAQKKHPIGDFETSPSAPSKTATAPMSEDSDNDEFEFEFDFITAATQAAVERENREAIAKAEAAAKADTRTASAFAFAVYPAVVIDPNRKCRASEQNAKPVQHRS